MQTATTNTGNWVIRTKPDNVEMERTSTLSKAREIVAKMEAQDEAEGTYEPGYYIIRYEEGQDNE